MLEYIKTKMEILSSYLSDRYLKQKSICTLGGWRSWRKENIKKSPIKYFLIEEFLGNFTYILERLIINPIYNLKSKYIKKWHYVKIDIQRFTTNNNSYDIYKLASYHYMDPVDIILAVNFQILVDFVEQEGYQTDWSSHNNDIWNEINILYIWWIKGRREEEKKYQSPKFSEYDINKDIFKEYTLGQILENNESFQKCKDFEEAHDVYIDVDDTQGKREQEMLVRLVKIRRYLWS